MQTISSITIKEKGTPGMDILIDVLRLLVSIVLAFLAGKLISKLKRPLSWAG